MFPAPFVGPFVVSYTEGNEIYQKKIFININIKFISAHELYYFLIVKW